MRNHKRRQFAATAARHRLAHHIDIRSTNYNICGAVRRGSEYIKLSISYIIATTIALTGIIGAFVFGYRI